MAAAVAGLSALCDPTATATLKWHVYVQVLPPLPPLPGPPPPPPAPPLVEWDDVSGATASLHSRKHCAPPCAVSAVEMTVSIMYLQHTMAVALQITGRHHVRATGLGGAGGAHGTTRRSYTADTPCIVTVQEKGAARPPVHRPSSRPPRNLST